MPNPMFLKVMGMEINEYQSLTDDEKAEFQEEARKRLAETADDPEAYAALTKSVENPEPRVARTFKRPYKKNKENQ